MSLSFEWFSHYKYVLSSLPVFFRNKHEIKHSAPGILQTQNMVFRMFIKEVIYFSYIKKCLKHPKRKSESCRMQMYSLPCLWVGWNTFQNIWVVKELDNTREGPWVPWHAFLMELIPAWGQFTSKPLLCANKSVC